MFTQQEIDAMEELYSQASDLLGHAPEDLVEAIHSAMEKVRQVQGANEDWKNSVTFSFKTPGIVDESLKEYLENFEESESRNLLMEEREAIEEKFETIKDKFFRYGETVDIVVHLDHGYYARVKENS